MTPTEIIYSKMSIKPKSTLLLGNRSLDVFAENYFSDTQDVLKIEHLTSELVVDVTHFSCLAPRGDRRVIFVRNLCESRRDVQATLLKLIEDSPDKTFWVFSIRDKSRILSPIISRSFLLDWVEPSSQTQLFTDELKQLLTSKDYVDLFKLHSKISQMAGKDSEQVKNLHLSCLTELMFLVPSEVASKLQKHKKNIIHQNKTEIGFKTALLEVLP
jgi:hypothetical protein